MGKLKLNMLGDNFRITLDEMRIKEGKNEVLHEMEDVEGFISLLSNEIYKCFRDWHRNTKI